MHTHIHMSNNKSDRREAVWRRSKSNPWAHQSRWATASHVQRLRPASIANMLERKAEGDVKGDKFEVKDQL